MEAPGWVDPMEFSAKTEIPGRTQRWANKNQL